MADGSIDFDHVSFSYKQGSGKNALSDIDLHIKSGETIGVIGGTGSGKSSLVNLICRLYDVSEGSVRAVSYTHLSALFTALGDGTRSAIISFARTFGFLMAGLLLLPRLLGVPGVWLAVPAAEALSCVLSGLLLWRNRGMYGWKKA